MDCDRHKHREHTSPRENSGCRADICKRIVWLCARHRHYHKNSHDDTKIQQSKLGVVNMESGHENGLSAAVNDTIYDVPESCMRIGSQTRAAHLDHVY